MLIFLDYFFMVFHSLLVVFNVTGWIWKRTRLVNLITLLLTGGSWVILGIFYGFGYCPLTDWHWTVLRRLGKTELPLSYIEYLTERIFPVDISPTLADRATAVGFIFALLASVILNIRDKRKANG